MFGQKTLAVATIGLLTSFGAVSADAASIGWNYQGVGGVGLNPGDVAGAPGFAQANWNNHAGAGQGAGTTPFGPLMDDSAGVTGVNVTAWTVSSGNSWQYGETSTPDEILLNDFNDRDPSVTFSGVNSAFADGYTVVVYYGNNEFNFNGGATIDVNGATQNTLTNGAFSGTGYVENTDDGATGSNYTVFTGVSGDVLTVALNGGGGNDGISAIQITDVPEPGSLALLGLGGLMFVRRRRG